MGVSWDNIALCIKLCKSNFYWVEFSDTQVEVRILLNVENPVDKLCDELLFSWAFFDLRLFGNGICSVINVDFLLK